MNYHHTCFTGEHTGQIMSALTPRKAPDRLVRFKTAGNNPPPVNGREGIDKLRNQAVFPVASAGSNQHSLLLTPVFRWIKRQETVVTSLPIKQP